MHRCLTRVLLAGAIPLLAFPLRSAPPEQIKGDEQALHASGLRTDGKSLLAFFKSRTPGERTIEDIEGLVRRLGHESFRVRRRASEELVRVGPQALKPLRHHENSKDPEVARRIRTVGMEPTPTTPEGLTAYLEGDIAKAAKVAPVVDDKPN